MNTKIHLLAADVRTAIIYSLSLGQTHDAPEGRELLKSLGLHGHRTCSWIELAKVTRRATW